MMRLSTPYGIGEIRAKPDLLLLQLIAFQVYYGSWSPYHLHITGPYSFSRATSGTVKAS
jgi:hypothetical protein